MKMMNLMHDLYVDCKGCVNYEKSPAVHWKLENTTNLHLPAYLDLHVTTITVISVISRISSKGRDSQLVIYLVYLLKTALHVPFLKADRQKNDNLC